MTAALPAAWLPPASAPWWIGVTVAAYAAGVAVQRGLGGAAWANPVLIAVALVVAVATATSTPYADYVAGARPVHLLLGPATVALAVPLAGCVRQVRRNLWGTGAAMLAGSATTIASGVLIVRLLGGGRVLALSMAPKAATTPIAMAVAGEVGGLPALTAALAILGGIVAAVAGGPILRGLRVRDGRAHGLAAGLAGSGIAAAQAARSDPLAAAFAALGLGLNGLLTPVLAPALIALLL